MKKIEVIKADGTKYELDALPSLTEMQEIVDGHIEPVRVLRGDLPALTHTYMVVNEEGGLFGLPYNAEATKLYQADIARLLPTQHGGSQIVGDVIHFSGWTVGELLAAGF